MFKLNSFGDNKVQIDNLNNKINQLSFDMNQKKTDCEHFKYRNLLLTNENINLNSQVSNSYYQK